MGDLKWGGPDGEVYGLWTLRKDGREARASVAKHPGALELTVAVEGKVLYRQVFAPDEDALRVKSEEWRRSMLNSGWWPDDPPGPPHVH